MKLRIASLSKWIILWNQEVLIPNLLLLYPLVVGWLVCEGETMEKSEQLVAAAERDPYPSLNPQNQCNLTAHNCTSSTAHTCTKYTEHTESEHIRTAVLNPKCKLQTSNCYTLTFEQNRWLTAHTTHSPLHRLAADCLGWAAQVFLLTRKHLYTESVSDQLYIPKPWCNCKVCKSIL